MPDAPSPDWRDSGNKPEAGGAKPWQPAPTSTGASAALPSRRSVKRTVAVVALVTLAAFIGVVVYWFRPIKPACLVLIGSGYEQNLLLPHNVHGWNGLHVLEKEVAADEDVSDLWRFRLSQPNKMRRVGTQPVEVTEANWRKLWDKIGISSYKEQTVVVFLSMHGLADAKEAYLLPNVSGKALDSAEQARIPFRDVLDSLKAVKGKKIVLLLDVCQAQTNMPTGMLHNDFVERLQANYAKEIEGIPNLTVICSAGVDQRSWASDELQNSVFAYFVTQGLQGADHGANANVTAGSLFDYVQKKVDNWAQTNRARKQTPILLGGESRAKGMDLVHIAEPYAKEASAVPALDVAGLGTEWDKWQSLKTDNAPPLHSPHFWRLYQDTLLRYEALVRAGDPTNKAKELKQNLEKLYGDLTASRSLAGAYGSLGSSFPMYRVLGYHPPGDLSDSNLQAFLTSVRKLDIDKASDEERTKVMSRFRDKSLLEKQYARTRLSRFVLKDLQGTRSRAQEQERLGEIENVLVAPRRPVEAQLLKMMQDTDRTLDDETIQLALSVRTLAEEAALSATGDGELYAEVILPWIRADIDAGDKLCREGEDLLFGSPKIHAPKARVKLKEAQEKYQSARVAAQRLQSALALRDEASAELPYFAAWLAIAPPLSDSNKEEIQELRQAAEKIGVDLASLNRGLDAGNHNSVPSIDLLNQLAGNLKRIREAYQVTSEKLRTLAVQQKNWHALDAALSVPPASARAEDVDLRKNLLRKQRDIGGTLLLSTNPQGKVEEEEPLERRVKICRDLLRACLKSFEEVGGQDAQSIDEKARDFFFKMPQEIVAKSETLNAEGPDLVRAASLCRAIPAGYVDAVRDEAKKRLNPVDRLRRLRMYNLLVAQAERTLADHWFEPGSPKADPYYDSVGKGYLASARGLFDDEQIPEALVKRAERVRSQFVPAHLSLGKLDKLQWTTETDFTLAYQVSATKGVPEGTPMIWLEVGNGAATEKVWPRKPMTTWPKFDDAFPLDQTGFAGDSVLTVNLHAYYRGQHLRESSPSVRSRPNVIVRYSPALKENTSLAVRMDSTFDYGAISIVLDNSGSMKFRYPKKGDKDEYADRTKERRRFDYALDALDHVLRKIPDNTYLSIFTLGDKDGTKVARYRPPTPWHQDKLGALRADLEEIPADIGSPIADAVVKSMDEGFPEKGFKGPKVVLVLTDGDDNGSFRDEPNDRTSRIVEELKVANVNHPEIVVVVVCFIDKNADPKSAAEYQSAKAQFGIVEQFKKRGQFLDVPEGEKLGGVIEDLLRPRIQLLQLAEQEPILGFQAGQPINYHNDRALNWKKVMPGEFNAHVLRTSANPLVNVQMLPGQKLFLVLHRMDEKLSLKRGLLADQPETAKRGEWRRDKDGWVVSLLESENRGLRTSILKQLLVFEKREREVERVRQPVPGLAWVELDSLTGSKPDQTLRWWRDWNVPAPALRVEMRDWPTGSQPKVSAWFWPDDRDSLFAKRELVMRTSLPVPFRLKMNADAGELPAIEYIDWKEREVENSSGEKVKRDCLIVRVRHAEGKPVWIDLEDRPPGIGSEHHYFTEARSTTCYFYGLTRPALAKLVWIDLAAFKKLAQKVEFATDGRIEAPRMFVPEAP